MAGARLIGIGSLMSSIDGIKDRWTGGSAKWVVGTNVEYAVYVEFGTSRLAAQPYLRPAAENAVAKADAFATQANSTDEFVELLALQVEREAKEFAPVDTGNLRASITAEKL